ncbi:hypothetical protein BMIN_3003 [Bifidobacterium minimum]|uniref:Uncharacterized protein n=1 Tax=Bifidobacterium minimum TaxID=1693 RepID=A0A087BT60_9BIFI|nr:hypothetical protein BMIN_3003 [Bifidobacterium minimum]
MCTSLADPWFPFINARNRIRENINAERREQGNEATTMPSAEMEWHKHAHAKTSITHHCRACHSQRHTARGILSMLESRDPILHISGRSHLRALHAAHTECRSLRVPLTQRTVRFRDTLSHCRVQCPAQLPQLLLIRLCRQ